MREIKFRAWDEQAKTMHHNFQSIKSGDLNIGGIDWIIPLEPITNEDWIERLTEHCKEAPHSRDQFKLMQFTGLLDKDGKEIYEGDILRGMWGEQGHTERQEIVGSVVFDNGCFEWKTWLKSFRGFDGRHSIMWRDYFPSGDEFREMDAIEIIGNIYENPEIMEL